MTRLATRLLLALACMASSTHATLLIPPGSDTRAVTGNPADAHIVRGMKALASHNWVEATNAFTEAMKIDPTASLPLLGLADAAMGQGDRLKAWSWLDKTLKAFPNDSRAHQAAARYHYALGDFDRAEQELKQALRLGPGNALAQIDLGDLYMNARRQPVLAIKAYQAAIGLNPGHAGAHFALGNALAMTGKHGEAIAALIEAQRLAPANPFTQQALAQAYLATGNLKSARTVLDHLIAASPAFSPAWLDRSDLRLAQGDPDGALQDALEAVKRAPAHDVAHMKLGMLYQARQLTTKAEQAYLEAIRLNPRLALAYNNLAWMTTETGKRLEQGEDWGKKAVALNPDSAEFLDTLAWVFRARGKLAEAEQALLRASQMRNATASLFYHLGEISQQLGKREAAVAAYKKSLSLDKNHPAASQALAKLQKP